MKTFLAMIAVLFLSVVAATAQTSSPTPDELMETQRWAAAKFAGRPETIPARGYLEVALKSGTLGKNGVQGRTLRILHAQYGRGLHCPSEGHIVVHLPGPAESFEAVVGVDSNDVGYYSNSGRGSVIAAIEVRGKEVFRSEVLREGLAGVPVKVDLGGARDFTLKLSDAGQGTLFGNDFNQADWALARVRMADGRTLWLDELPVGPLRAPYTADPPFSFRYGGQASEDLLKT